MAIARAVLEYAADRKRLGAKTLFATHYHELTDIEQALPGVKNFNIAVKKRQGDMIFLRKIVPGAADDSYGIEVAKLAGIPDRVITRAREILKDLESGAPERAKPAAAPVSDQVSMLDMQSDELRRALGVHHRRNAHAHRGAEPAVPAEADAVKEAKSLLLPRPAR